MRETITWGPYKDKRRLGKREKEFVRQLGEVYGSLKGNKQNMYNLNLWVKSITKMHDSKDRTVAFTL